MKKKKIFTPPSPQQAQIHLIGNIVIWYSATVALVVYALLFAWYLLRRRRQCYDLTTSDWHRFRQSGELFFVGYLLHFVPFFFVERTLFLHNYMPALVFKVLLLCCVIDHIGLLVARSTLATRLYRVAVVVWLTGVVWVFWRFAVLSYGTNQLTAGDVIALRWKETWDFILHKDVPKL